ncbi:MAG: 3-dehydroquinate synthase [Patescibacteria group bacterium]
MVRLLYRVKKESKCTLVVGKGALRALPGLIQDRTKCAAAIITDRTVARLCSGKLRKVCDARFSLHLIALNPGERSKKLRNAERCIRILLQHKVDRHGTLVALGGGVVGDLTGFVASVYLRGIDYIQVPTTLLAMVDSGIGGKTGVDFQGVKNVVGTFHQPRAVVCDTAFLRLLPHDELVNGMAEVIKYGLIGSQTLCAQLARSSFSRMPWEKVVQFCVRTKAAMVAQDPLDRKGRRALLNFGHTVGHALESLSRFSLSHGQAIAIGMVAAARLSYQLSGLSQQECEAIETLIAKYELPTRLPPHTDIGQVMKVMQNDKKAEDGDIKWVLLEKIGKARAGVKVPEEAIRETLERMK